MRNTDFDSKLIIHKSRRIKLISGIVLMTIAFTAILVRNNKEGYAWYVVAIPMIGIGLLFLLLPMTEEWQYKPWQAKPRRVEQQER